MNYSQQGQRVEVVSFLKQTDYPNSPHMRKTFIFENVRTEKEAISQVMSRFSSEYPFPGVPSYTALYKVEAQILKPYIYTATMKDGAEVSYDLKFTFLQEQNERDIFKKAIELLLDLKEVDATSFELVEYKLI